MPSSSQLHTQARILIVVDNPDDSELLQKLLRSYGYHHLSCPNDPQRIVALLEKLHPDLILLDMGTSQSSQPDFFNELKKHWAELAPPVLALTAQTDRESRIKALQLGARDLLDKPLDPQEIMHRIRNALEVHFLLKERHHRAALLQYLVEERTAAIHRPLEDPVTALPNRRALLDQLDTLLQLRETAAIYFIALEGIDDITRLHGVATGETLSLHLRNRLLAGFPSKVTIGIWNSTEWVMIARQPLTPDIISAQLRTLLHCIAEPITVEQLQARLAARVGISHTGMPHDSAEHLLRLAALALPETVGSRLYESSIEAALQRRTRQRQTLRSALDNRELSLVYQPKIELRSGRVVGAEALLRWQHPQLGTVSPAEFIPLAEASGDILRIGEWVIDSAIEQLEQWLDADLLPGDFCLAVNVAPLQLTQSQFARNLLARLELSSLPQGALEIEITESGLMRNVDLAREQLQQLAHARVSVAIDDFGTGHSSLANLKTLPVSVLKIDRAFVSGMDSDPQDLRLAETVIDMARNFGCHTVAEGVEKPEQADLLLALGCQMAQGYLYSPPLKAEQFLDYCLRQREPVAD